jgi:hypothetical protein
MNVRVFVAAVAGLAISIFAVVKLMGTGSAQVAQNPNMLPQPTAEGLRIAKSGPQPKAQVSEYEYHFDRMEVGETRSHDFIITNSGEAPLTIRMGDTTCQCTYADLKKGEERTIPPGESQKITLTWKPEFENDIFSKGADIITNDPDQQTIPLRVAGRVGTSITIAPTGEWPCEDLLDDQPGICSGRLTSSVLDSFNVTSIESHGAPLEFELVTMDSYELERSNKALCGRKVQITIKPEMQMGSFSIPVTIKTDVPDKSEHAVPGKLVNFDILISGVRRGPIRFAGPDWYDEKMGITMGSFKSTAGKQVAVPVFVRNPPAEGFQLTKPPEITPPDLQVELVRDEKSQGKSQRFTLKLNYPAGAPRGEHRGANPGKIRLWTNHPKAPEIEIVVFLNAY